ncbi:MAG: omega-6 fatty acid desaturase (delta-12 desaturase), partial [Thermoproteota archaeon]
MTKIKDSLLYSYLRENNSKLTDLQKLFSKDLLKVNELKAWSTFLRNIFFLLLNSFSIITLQKMSLPNMFLYPLLVICVYIQGLIFSGFFVTAHECGHYAFTKNKNLNELVGLLCLTPLLANFTSWIIGHNFHHKYSNTKGYESNWAEGLLTQSEYNQLSFSKKLEYRWSYGGIMGLVIGNLFAMTSYMFLVKSYPQIKSWVSDSSQRKISITNLFIISFQIILHLVFYYYSNLINLVLLYWLPFFIGSLFGSLFTYLHHINKDSYAFNPDELSPIQVQLLSTFDVRFPRHIEFFCHYINLHIVHHISPKIPWYNTIIASKQLKDSLGDAYQERTFSISYLLECWR